MNETQVTVVGNVTANPELRYTQNGIPVANFTIASTERVFDKQTQQMKDGDTIFYRTAAWRQLGEHVAASLQKGMQVIARGKLKHRQYEAKDGGTAYSLEIELEEIGVSLRFGTTQFTKSTSNTQQAAQAPAQVAQPQQYGQPVQPGPAPMTQPQYAAQPAAPQAAPVPQTVPGQPAPAPAAGQNVENMPDDLF